MRIEQAVAGIVAMLFATLCLILPAAALESETLRKFFAEPYSVGERDGEQPVWPIFKRTAHGDQLIAYVCEYADFAPVPPDPATHRLVALRPSGEFLEVKVFHVEKPGFFHWFAREPEFDFIRRDRAGDASPAIGFSRDFIRARLGLTAEKSLPAKESHE